MHGLQDGDRMGISENAKKTNIPGSWFVCFPKRSGKPPEILKPAGDNAKQFIPDIGGKQNLLAKVKKGGAINRLSMTCSWKTMGRIVSSGRLTLSPCNLALMVSSHFLQGPPLFSHHFLGQLAPVIGCLSSVNREKNLIGYCGQVLTLDPISYG